MIVTLYGKSSNKYTQQVREELEDAWPDYKFLEQFDWARDEQCRDQACHIREDGVARIQKMPTIRLEGELSKWLVSGDFVNPITRWHYVGQGDEYWIVGLEDCLEFVRGAKWPTASTVASACSASGLAGKVINRIESDRV